jgi:hypothetical protein
MAVPSTEDIDQVLSENAWLIKTVMKCQSEGRMMDAMLYQTRLQLNLVQLAAIADSGPIPTVGPQTIRAAALQAEPGANAQVQLSRFVRAVKEHGLKNISYIAKVTCIPVEKIAPIARAYIAFLKRENRFSEATQLDNELAIGGGTE